MLQPIICAIGESIYNLKEFYIFLSGFYYNLPL